MSDNTDQANPSIAIREGESLDWERLDAHLKQQLPELSGKPAISQYPAGNSNLTYRLVYANADLVLRRPPFGTKAKSAHSMSREYRVMNALSSVYPLVPETLYYSDDEAVIGSEFYIMRRVEGDIVHRKLPTHWNLDKSQVRQFCEAVWDGLIQLHQVSIEAAGLQDFGKPEGYIERQVGGWSQRFQKALTEDVDAFDDVQRWLDEQRPASESRHAVLHGDYRMDNVVVNPERPSELRAVLDWEISALGDPLMDLGNALAYWVEANDPPYLQLLQLQPSQTPGMLTRQEILDRYSAATGLDTSDFRFYLVYGYFRNMVIVQQIYYRYFHGQTRDERFKSFGQLANALGMHCRQLISA